MIEKILDLTKEKCLCSNDLIAEILGLPEIYELSIEQNVPTGSILNYRGCLKDEMIFIFETRNNSKSNKAYIPDVYMRIYTKTSPPIEEVYLIKEKNK